MMQPGRPGRGWTGRIARWAAAAAVLLVAAYCLVFWWLGSRTRPDNTPVAEVRILDQGWGPGAQSSARQRYYWTPQGVALKHIPYAWMASLERPWTKERFLSPRYLRAYGFVVAPVSADNPAGMPVGLTRHWDAQRREWMTDMTCALCHTGELDATVNGRRVAVRIDGGPAMHQLTSTAPGHFSLDLLASLAATYLDPFKYHRFARAVLGTSDTWSRSRALHAQLGALIGALVRQARSDAKLHLYVPEGPGRTDALGRIANQVFGTDLDPANYRVANAPVSYPPVWDIWKFDWVQYTASVRQPMARNLGESLGTGADLALVDANGRPLPPAERFLVSTIVPNLRVIESDLQSLRAPCWPEDVFGKINLPLATRGAALFAQYCQTCHGPHVAPPALKAFDAPLKSAAQPEWVMHLLSVYDIGTDPNAAINFVRNTYDLSRTGLTDAEVREKLAANFRPQYARQLALDAAAMQASAPGSAAYKQAAADAAALKAEGEDGYVTKQMGPVDVRAVTVGAGLTDLLAFIRPLAYERLNVAAADQPVWNGFGQLDTPQVEPQYKPRPLGGVWATAPYLHNGSVPNLYEMLSPANEREKVFYLGGRTFDPVKVGIVSDPNAPGAFRYDTSVSGNHNTGHEFRAGYVPWKPGDPPAHGVIGPYLPPADRMAIIEYLKVHRDDPDDHSCPVNVPLPTAAGTAASVKYP